MARLNRGAKSPSGKISSEEARLLKVFEVRFEDRVERTVRARLSGFALDAAAAVAAIGIVFTGWQLGQIVNDPAVASLSWKTITDNAVATLVVVCAVGASVVLGYVLRSRRAIRQSAGQLEHDIDDDLKRIASLKERLG